MICVLVGLMLMHVSQNPNLLFSCQFPVKDNGLKMLMIEHASRANEENYHSANLTSKKQPLFIFGWTFDYEPSSLASSFDNKNTVVNNGHFITKINHYFFIMLLCDPWSILHV